MSGQSLTVDLDSVQLIRICHIKFDDRETVTDTIVQDIDGDVGAIGGGGNIGAIGGRQRWSVERGFDRYEITDFYDQDFEKGNICLFNQTESITDVVLSVELPSYTTDDLTLRQRHISLTLINARSELDGFQEEVFRGVEVLGTSDIIRVIPEEDEPIRVNTSHLDLRRWGDFNSDLLDQFGYDPESYVSMVQDSFLLSPTSVSDIWDEFVAIECREQIPEGNLDVKWLNEYLIPLSVYTKAHHWQQNQKGKLLDIADDVDNASKTDWSLTDDFDVNKIATEQSELRELHDRWFKLHSEIIDDRDEIENLFNRIERSDKPGQAYERQVSTPSKIGVSVDNRSLFHRLSDEMNQEYETISERVEQLNSRYQNVANYFSDRVQAGSTVLNTENQKSNRRLQVSVVVLTLVLTVVGVVQGVNVLTTAKEPISTFLTAVAILVPIQIIILLLFGKLD
jgi:hypothetical protein